ncbi:NAD dehydrogenase [Multifurca ochricompacta]|uniref:L-2-hydroxyglutarate dehydrogenase, mitochondrial n=1 Tax=Multifurca ochricompacta TaxID=376703 RepID=A0AAD4M2V4_9AGAM|nr:NAD dehydrogenase [Multifurca ochricompacta]
MAGRVARGLTTSLNSAGRYKFKSPEAAVDHIVIGGGVVGLAITRALSRRFPDKTTILIERHSRLGEETSSRNSEVIHAGLYYPPDSLKTRLCLRRRQMLYSYCTEHNIPYRRVGKLVVGRDDQRGYLAAMHAKAQALNAPPHWDHSADPQVLPTEVLGGDAARERVPVLTREITSALWSPSTGIVDSAALLTSLEKDVEDAGGTIACATRAVRIDVTAESGDGWIVQTITRGSEESDGKADATLARVLINAAGLGATSVLNEILSPSRRIPLYFARGAYAAYRGPALRGIRHLVYPADEASAAKGASFHSLGTHLTLDMAGNVRFGPDIDWLPVPDSAVKDEDVWEAYLSPNEERARSMHAAVSRYLLGLKPEGFQLDYAGIRPKLAPPGAPFQDFVVRTDYADGRDGRAPMISLLGIESPGLTASLALAEMVVEDMLVGMSEQRM